MFDKEKRRKTRQPQCYLRWHKLKNAISPSKMSWNMKQPLQSKWPGRASAQELPPPYPRIRSEARPPPGQAASVGFIGIGGLEMPWQTSTQHLQCNMAGQKKSVIHMSNFLWALYCYTAILDCFLLHFLLVAKKNLQTSLIGFPLGSKENPGRLMPSVPFGSLAHAHGFGLAPPLPAGDSRRQARPTNGVGGADKWGPA